MGSEQTLAFIKDYKSYEALWDAKHKYYTNKSKRLEAYMVLAEKYQLTVKGVKNKIKSLRSYFAKEHQKVMEKTLCGEDGESNWFAYKPLLFISDSPMAQKDCVKSEGGSWTEEVSEVDAKIPRMAVEISDAADEEESKDTATHYSFQNEESPWMMNPDAQQLSLEECEPMPEHPSPLGQTIFAPKEMNSTSRKSHRREEYRTNEGLSHKIAKKTALSMALNSITRLHDDHKVFGDFVASSLRNLKSDKIRRKLRLDIQRVILEASMLDLSEQTDDNT